MIPAVVQRSTADRLIAKVGSNELDVTNATVIGTIDNNVTLCIRPERIRLLESSSEVDTSLEVIIGVVEQVLYSGNSLHFTISLDNNQSIHVHHPLNTVFDSSSIAGIGDTVRCGVTSATISIFSS